MVENPSIAWAAGLFEGEGCISWQRRHVTLSVASTDLDVLLTLQRVLLCGNIRRHQECASGKISHRWQVASCSEVLKVLWLLKPYFHERRRTAAEEAEKFLHENPPSESGIKTWETRRELYGPTGRKAA